MFQSDRYDLEKEPGTFKRIFTIDELTANVQFLDFSLDNMFLLYKNELDEAVITDIYSKKKINSIQSRFDFEWISDGIQISERTKVFLLENYQLTIFIGSTEPL